MSRHPTKATWYTCHWWGESVLDFITCCDKHSKVRHLPSAAYWVCAYANRQHELDQEIGLPDLRDTSFYKAMQEADGVVLILDAEAMPFQRMWCSFEIYKAITTEKKLDVAAVTRSNGGACEGSIIIEDSLPWEPTRGKIVRQQAFPHHLLVEGMWRRLERGGCSVEADIERILHFIGQDVAEDHPEVAALPDEAGRIAKRREIALRKANGSLKAYFAISAWPFAVEFGLVQNFAEGDRICNLVELLRLDIERTKLSFSVAHIEGVEDYDVQDIADALPPNLTELELSFEGCRQITKEGVCQFKGKFNQGLVALSLTLRECF